MQTNAHDINMATVQIRAMTGSILNRSIDRPGKNGCTDFANVKEKIKISGNYEYRGH
jgi:hypothetical protein